MTAGPAKRKKTRESKLINFDADKQSILSEGIFGLPFDLEESEAVIIPVPWDVTAPHDGAADAPDAIFQASKSISLYQEKLEDAWKAGIYMHNIPLKWKESSYQLRKIRNRIHKRHSKKMTDAKRAEQSKDCKNINLTSRLLNEWVEQISSEYLKDNKLVGLLGGGQAISSGFLTSLSRKYDHFGILHLDAHADLLSTYEGLEFSDFSSMHYALKLSQVKKLVLAGCREILYSEQHVIEKNYQLIKLFSDKYIKEKHFRGNTLKMMISEIISPLPKNVYISFDAAIMQAEIMPNVGFPQPSGFSFEEISFLFSEIQQSGKKIIGFDLSGIRPRKENNYWEAKLGAHLLFELSSLMINTLKK
ncbi:MAG: arginase family protein [Bacteroidetes bacterium]|nr:arginase family protein [Bacteroidota bacterium]MBL6963519.1 arginase family protein [Bacteroidota bacterium]